MKRFLNSLIMYAEHVWREDNYLITTTIVFGGGEYCHIFRTFIQRKKKSTLVNNIHWILFQNNVQNFWRIKNPIFFGPKIYSKLFFFESRPLANASHKVKGTLCVWNTTQHLNIDFSFEFERFGLIKPKVERKSKIYGHFRSLIRWVIRI